MQENEREPEAEAGNRDGSEPAPITFDLEALLQVVDVRPDALSLAAEHEWTERHLTAARRALRGDFDPKSLAIFECLLAGEDVSDVAVLFRTSDQAVYKIKQRVTRRLTEIVRRSIEIEERGENGSADAPRGAGH
jgi:hypothetical protein